MDNRHINNEYAEIADELIRHEPSLLHLLESRAKIIFLSSDYAKTSKGKLVFGQCEKIQDKYKWGIPADFTITVFEPNTAKFTEDQIRILLHHELLHVGIDKKADGSESYSIVDHDIEDFKLILDKYGTGWSRT
jgi:hypothetical protein